MYIYISILYTYHIYIYIHICIFVLYNLFPTVIDPPAHVLKNQQVPHADWWSDWYMTYCDSSFTRNSVGDSLFKVWVKLRLLFPHTPKQLYGDSPLTDFESSYIFSRQKLQTVSLLFLHDWFYFFKGFLFPFSTKNYQRGLGSYRSAKCWIPSNASSPGGPGT